MGDFASELATQSWSLYGVGMFLIALRMYARTHRLGWRSLQIDDYLMLTVGAWYTILIVCLNVIATGGGSNLYPPEDFETFTPEDIQERIKGSKIVVLSEQAMLNVIYTIKACLIIMYTRLTLHHTHQNLIKYLAVYVALGWIATEIAFFTACRPFYGYWAMPPPNPQCTTLEHYAIVQACFNLSSDTLMLFIPLPLVTTLNVHWKQKVILTAIFSLGIFVIIAAILTKVYNLSDVWDTAYMLWYTREASVAVYVSNLPMIWPLMREYIPFLRNLTPVNKSTSKRTYGAGTSGQFAVKTIGSSRSKRMGQQDGITTTITIRGKDEEDFGPEDANELGVIHRQGSEDRLRPGSDTRSSKEGVRDLDYESAGKGGILVGRTVQVTEEHITSPPAFDGGYGPYRSRATREADGNSGSPPLAFEWEFEKGRH